VAEPPLSAMPPAEPSPNGRHREQSIPVGNFERARLLLGRALTRRCPYCGGRGIFASYFSLKDQCPHCGARFDREEGYFLGGYALNLIVAEFIGLGLALVLIFGTAVRHAPLLAQEGLAVAFAVLLPIVFFPYSRTLWMALDLYLNPPHKHPERQLRSHEIDRPPEPGGRRKR
jgi:uncharacterized protein (DUF983 family)